jgi:hypothetical protein
MTSLMRIILVSSVLTLPLASCASVSDSLDPTEWFSGELFNTKKKLPGDRKVVFPEGVPGQGQSAAAAGEWIRRHGHPEPAATAGHWQECAQDCGQN